METPLHGPDVGPPALERIRRAPKVLLHDHLDGGLRPSRNPLVEMVYVTEGLDAADDHIADHAGEGDIVLTNDIPLADRALKAGARVLRFDGEELTSRNIASRLAARNAADHHRETTAMRLEATQAAGGGRAFTARDRQSFVNALERLVRATVPRAAS